MSEAPRHFLDLSDFDGETLRNIITAARSMKHSRAGLHKGVREGNIPLAGKIVALIFQQPSTRTRVSFEVGIRQLGGESLLISASDMQLGRGETIADTARVLSRFVDAIMIRAKNHDDLMELAEHATVPVINGLTNKSHPCQIMADILTLEEHVGPLAEQTIAWVGDGNNVAASLVHAVTKLGGKLRLACPETLSLSPDLLKWARSNGADITVTTSADVAVAGATCVVTDAWVSMHDADASNRHNLLKPYQINGALMKKAAPNAVFMHCLPAHRGEEVTSEVMDGPQSVVFDEAENRLHAQKAILLHCLGVE
ncbi:MAG: ornithine carbamoyltransferase [Aestuariivirga sp.]